MKAQDRCRGYRRMPVCVTSGSDESRPNVMRVDCQALMMPEELWRMGWCPRQQLRKVASVPGMMFE